MSKGILLGDVFPNFEAETNEGHIPSFHDWIGKDSWAILFSHPRDFTPVCTTECARLAQLAPEFKKRNVKLIGLSCDSAESHRKWINDIIALRKLENGGGGDCCADKLPFPIIADENRCIATKLGMMDPEERDETGAALTARCLFIIGPEKTLKLSILYPATTGRNFKYVCPLNDKIDRSGKKRKQGSGFDIIVSCSHIAMSELSLSTSRCSGICLIEMFFSLDDILPFSEILRVIDSLQLTAVKQVATPVDWKDGDDCVVIPTLDDAEAKKIFGEKITTVELPSARRYLRIVPHPK
ncbi:unnamed protein product [Thelazia callipaeda]|uniref:1-Cys peroxiredoxin n=1 Tax=Thelazia callipaeda TaxID=103827 RepID=A0A158RBM9_THECL|nr:unnamed protein product [Thelazia callipaeda]